MALYECVFIARQDIATAQVEALTNQFSEVIQENGGQVAKVEQWGLKTLAYRIRKNRKGHYVLMNLDAPHAAVAELERQMGLNEDILRHLVIRVDELEEGPSAMLQSRSGGRDDRRGGGRDIGGRREERRDRDDKPREDRAPRARSESEEGATA